MEITKEYLAGIGWVEKSGIMVLFSNPRIGWKEGGTLIIGWHEWPEKVTTIEQLTKITTDMPTKVFTTLGGSCPFGRGIEIDTPGCRKCQYFYRAGTATFFWCNHPVPEEKVAPLPLSPIVKQTRKRGRPPKKAISGPNKARKRKR